MANINLLKEPLLPSRFISTSQSREAAEEQPYQKMCADFREKFKDSTIPSLKNLSDKKLYELISIAETNNWDFKLIVDGLKYISEHSTSFSNEGGLDITKNKFRSSTIKFMGYEYKNKYGKEGFFENIHKVKTSPVHGFCKNKFSGQVQEGGFLYIPELGQICLVESKETYFDPLKPVQKGRFKYIPELDRMCLVNGEKNYPDKSVEEGRFKYIPELDRMCLFEGKIICASGQVQEGIFQYSDNLNKMILVSELQYWVSLP